MFGNLPERVRPGDVLRHDEGDRRAAAGKRFHEHGDRAFQGDPDSAVILRDTAINILPNRLADRLRSARLATMHWGGHAVNITNQESFDALLRDFLATSN